MAVQIELPNYYNIGLNKRLPNEIKEDLAHFIASTPSLLAALRDACNTLYALRDHAQAEGLPATVEQAAIDKIKTTIASVERG